LISYVGIGSWDIVLLYRKQEAQLP